MTLSRVRFDSDTVLNSTVSESNLTAVTSVTKVIVINVTLTAVGPFSAFDYDLTTHLTPAVMTMT